MSTDLSLTNVPRSSTGLIMPKGVIFYYLCEEAHGPFSPRRLLGCACFGRQEYLSEGESPVFCRGVAMCSGKDNFSRKVARELAYRRYLRAAHVRKSTEKVHRQWVLYRMAVAVMEETFKSAYQVLPSPKEAYLWDKLNKKEKVDADQP